VTGTTYWDYVQENIFKRCGMTGSAFYTRPQWLTGKHIAHPYLTLADGSVVDAVRNLDKDSPDLEHARQKSGPQLHRCPRRRRLRYRAGSGPVRTRAGRRHAAGPPWADVLTAAKIPHGPASFGAYGIPVSIVNGQWKYQRAGGNPGVIANWDIYPYTGWVGVILGNCDGVPAQEMIGQEMQAITGPSPAGGGGGGGG
jgi:CubicO group peptidase (beta-lactamase class C family)